LPPSSYRSTQFASLSARAISLANSVCRPEPGNGIRASTTGSVAALTFRFEATAQGKFMLAVMFGQSKYYVDNLSENIRRGQRQKLRDGI
jgi:hypothetical protein